MFFGKRRKQKPEDRVPVEFGGDDFGFDEPDRPAPKKKEERPRPEVDEDFEQSSTGGRTLDDATFVGHRAPREAPLRAEPPPPGGGEDEELPDATRVIGPPPDVRATIVAWLVAASGPSRGRDYRLDTRPTRVGSATEAEIRLPGDPYVSTEHAEVVLEGEEAIVRDLGSTNGTYCNDERIRETVLRDGDRLRFGLSEFVFTSVRL